MFFHQCQDFPPAQAFGREQQAGGRGRMEDFCLLERLPSFKFLSPPAFLIHTSDPIAIFIEKLKVDGKWF